MSTRTISTEVIITLPNGEVICRQILTRIEVPKGHCAKLAMEMAKKRVKAGIKKDIKIEVI